MKNIIFRRCLSGNEFDKTLAQVARVTWEESGEEYGIETEVGDSEDDLLVKLAALVEMAIAHKS